MARLLREWKLPRGRFVIYDSGPTFFFNQVSQIHDHQFRLATSQTKHLGQADAIISNLPIPLVVLTADCLPVLIIGEKGTAFIHAGWRGLQQQILTQDEVRSISPQYAFIGPHISAKHYEVGEAFKSHFPQSHAFENHFGKICFSLEKEAIFQLTNQFPQIKIESTGLCTFEEKELFSFRKNKTNQRNWNTYIPY